MIFLSFKKFRVKFVTTLNFFRNNIIKFWIKFGNKLGSSLKLQLYLFILFYFIRCEFW